MLTPYLESLIIKGQAQYKTAVVGIGAVTTIIVPVNCYAVITDLLYFPYVDQLGAYPAPATFSISRFINQIWIRSRQGNNHYLVRPTVSSLHVDGQNSYPFFSDIKIDTYLVHDGQIKIDFSNIDGPADWLNIDNGALQDESNEEQIGYGTATLAPSLNVIKGVEFSNSQWYRPPTNERDPQPATNQGSNQYRQNPTLGQNANIGSNNQAFPILNIGYIEIQGKPEYLKA